MRRLRYTEAQIAEAIRRAHGVKALACRALHCWPSTLDRYLHRFPALQEIYEEERGTLVDTAYDQLQKAVWAGRWKAVRFTLTRLGRDQGYGKRHPKKPATTRRKAPQDVERALELVYGDTAGHE